jgi:hypothetical protein
MLGRSLFAILAIVLSVLLRYTNSDYPFGIVKLFLPTNKTSAQRSTKHTHKTKYRVTGTPLKNWGTDKTMAKVKSESK